MRAASYRITTESVVEPISLTELKSQLRIDYNDDDTILGNIITAARQHCEMFTNRSFIEKTITATFKSFKDSNGDQVDFELPLPYLLSVTSVKYYDTDDTLQTITNTDYTVNTTRFPGSVRFKSDYSIPELSANYDEPIQVIFKAGFGDAAEDVPLNFKQAVLLVAATFYENRNEITSFQNYEMPLGIKAILKPLRYQNSW